jgi:hypothetical protein
MSDGLNAMLEEGQRSPSLCQGVIRLLSNFKGAPLASQMRPVTFLTTDFKLVTKVCVARLVGVLFSVLQKWKLCLVRGRNIMQGAMSLWSTVEFIRQRRRRGFFFGT